MSRSCACVVLSILLLLAAGSTVLAADQYVANAKTVNETTVYASPPVYSLIKGAVIPGEIRATLPEGTDLQLLESRVIGVVNVWWHIQYMSDAAVFEGWIAAAIRSIKSSTMTITPLQISDPAKRNEYSRVTGEVR